MAKHGAGLRADLSATLFDATAHGPKFTEAELLERLRSRYTTFNGNGPRWAFATHVRDRAGFDATRTLDAVAMDTWPSSGLLLHGFEVKCSRSDWLRELARPEKAAAFTCRLDRFWIVAPIEVVKPDELPEAWGLLETRGAGLVQKVAAGPLEPLPLDRSFVAALFRAATYRHSTHRPTRSEQSLEGAAVNGLTPVGQEANPR